MNKNSRIIIKLGTGLIINESLEVNASVIDSVSHQVSELVNRGFEVVLVSSGAIALGQTTLNINSTELSLSQKQALAATGQPLLMQFYSESFARQDHTVAQVLLTPDDLSHRQSYLNLKSTIEELLKLRTVPILNENDTTSTKELIDTNGKSFGDNDVLSALVAAKLNADLLIILTNVEGLFTKDPSQSDSKQIKEVKCEADFPRGTEGKSQHGRGGVQTKIKAARIAALCGVKCIITSGNLENVIANITEGKEFSGTTVYPFNSINSKKRWIGFSKSLSGFVTVNTGAKKALEENQASLLPVGITSIKGTFEAGELISIVDDVDHEVGRGICSFSSKELTAVLGKNSAEIKSISPNLKEEFIHRDSLVVFKELYRESD